MQRRSRSRPECSISLLMCVESVFVKQELKDQMQDCHAQSKDLVTQTFSGIHTVRSFKGEKDELRRFKESLDRMCAVERRSRIYSSVFCLIRRVRWQRCTSMDHMRARERVEPSTRCMEAHFHQQKKRRYEKYN